MAPGTHEIFNQIVLDGLYTGLGMVSFADVLDEKQAGDIHNYLIDQANLTWEQQHRSGWWADLMDSIYNFVGDLVGPWMAPVSE